MKVVGVSLNHRVTSLEDRERLAFASDETRPFLLQVTEQFDLDEAFIVSTCHRTELYAIHNEERAGREPLRASELVRALARDRDFVPSDCPPNFEGFEDRQAIRHLFRVAGGLDSQILGEAEILGQIKRARDASREVGTEGRVIGRLLDRALRAGKRIRSETSLGEGALSHATAALQLARRIFGSLEGRKVLVVGAGEIAELAVENLVGTRVAEVGVVNRTAERAARLVDRFSGVLPAVAKPFEALADAIAGADLVLSSTAATEPIIDLASMKRVRRSRRSLLPTLIIDLALPRDIDPNIAKLDDVFLKNLEDLEEIIRINQAQRSDARPAAEAIVSGEVETFSDWLFVLEVQPTIVELRELFERIRAEEMRTLGQAFDPKVHARIDAWSKRLVSRLLYMPIENLKRHEQLRDVSTRSVVHDLFTKELPHPRERRQKSESSGRANPERSRGNSRQERP